VAGVLKRMASLSRPGLLLFITVMSYFYSTFEKIVFNKCGNIIRDLSFNSKLIEKLYMLKWKQPTHHAILPWD
jgi:hypothetical protein